MDYNRKIMRLELSAENPVHGGYYYAELLLPAADYEIKDAMQRTRAVGRENTVEVSILECDILPELQDIRLDTFSLDELNFVAKRLASLPNEELPVFYAVTEQIFNDADENPVSIKDLINCTYGLDTVPVAHNVSNLSELGRFAFENGLLSDLDDIPESAIPFLNAEQIGRVQQKNDSGVFEGRLYIPTVHYPFNFSGKTDPQGAYIGRDKYGTNILVDFDRRAEDKTNSNALILGNSGQGKSYLLKLILTNIRESGKRIICLDPESEYETLCDALGGCYIDFMSGEYTINPLEPKAWTDSVEDIDATTPEAFKKVTRLSQHIAFLKDFFRSYKDFTDAQIDTIEILLSKLYARFGITDSTDYSVKKPSDFPVMQDFYNLCEEEFMTYDKQRKYLYTEETLQEVCLGIHSMCVGSESKYFNGHTNINDSNFLVFGVKGLMDTNRRLKDCMLFNILSYMSNELLGKGSTAASVDELYLFLSNMTTIEYLRNCMKRVRKKDSSVILASQNTAERKRHRGFRLKKPEITKTFSLVRF